MRNLHNSNGLQFQLANFRHTQVSSVWTEMYEFYYDLQLDENHGHFSVISL